MTNQTSSTKKFLYTGPTNSKPQEYQSELNLKQDKKEKEDLVDLDNVWSIKKNVGVKKSNSIDDKLTLNADTKFYSRHNNLKGYSGQIQIKNDFSEDKNIPSPQDPTSSAFYQRRNSNTSRRHSITPEDEFDF